MHAKRSYHMKERRGGEENNNGIELQNLGPPSSIRSPPPVETSFVLNNGQVDGTRDHGDGLITRRPASREANTGSFNPQIPAAPSQCRRKEKLTNVERAFMLSQNTQKKPVDPVLLSLMERRHVSSFLNQTPTGESSQVEAVNVGDQSPNINRTPIDNVDQGRNRKEFENIFKNHDKENFPPPCQSYASLRLTPTTEHSPPADTRGHHISVITGRTRNVPNKPQQLSVKVNQFDKINQRHLSGKSYSDVVPAVSTGQDSRVQGPLDDFNKRKNPRDDKPSTKIRLDLVVEMGETDRLFGFSVRGGVDDNMQPIVEEIEAGSPADRAELEVGDEIVEVNGQSMDGYSHRQIISHIHRCIKSRTIKLRVKRSRPESEQDPITSDINDAYVIAVDEEAKKRLETLSALHKVKAIDICRLQDLGNNNIHKGELSGVNNHQVSVIADVTDNLSQVDEESESCDCELDTPEPLDIEFSESANQSPAKVSCDTYEPITDQNAVSVTMEMTAVVNGYQDSRYHQGGYKDPHNMRNYPATPHMYDQVDMEDFHEDTGPHREMAIDCPSNFVPVKKEPPRFPPRSSQYNTPVSNNKHTTEDIPYHPNKMTADEKERLRMYQLDLQRRREEEDRITREQDFLRTSLRGSKKLQSLEEQRREQMLPSGIINPNYVEEEETSLTADSTSKASTLPVRHQGAEPLNPPIGREVLLQQLQHFQKKLRSIEDQKDVAFLQTLFHNPRFHHAMSTYNKVAEVTLKRDKATPHDANSSELTSELLAALPKHTPNGFVGELRVLLQTPHLKSLLECHDKVAEQSTQPVNNTTEDDEREYLYERASQYGDEIKIVRIQKTADPLGATVRNDNERVLIGRIVKGGAAEKSGLLHEGDEILEINGIDIRGKSVNDVCDLMASLTGTLTFLIIPCLDQLPGVKEDSVMHIRAHFNYDPEEDLYIPCRELGIGFEKGDVLHVINQDDLNWWQAYREGEEDQSLAGLIPSKTFQEQKESMKQTIVGDTKEDKKKNRCRCGRRSNKKKKKKQLYDASGGEELDAEEILTYEEVALYYPQPNRKRPIVLIGPPNVGRQELRQRLMESDEDRFAAAIPHTSRTKKDDELDSKDYHFVDRHVFEHDITQHKFVEYGEYEKNLYGTSLEAIREVVNSGKICILNLYPQSLRVLKASDLKPYIVFIAPPNIEKLKQLRQKQGVKVTDTELIEIIEKAREMEENYGHYFDQIIMNYDLDRAYQELISEINKLEVEPQWVPSHWVT